MDHTIREASHLVREIYRIVDRLEAIFPGRHFTPDGHMVGSIGEVLAAARYGLELLPASTPLHDARASDGRNVQVKATQSNHIAFRGEQSPEHLIVLSLNRDGTTTEEYNGPGHEPWSAAGALQDNGQRPLTIARLRALMENTIPTQRLPEMPPGEAVLSTPNMKLEDVECILVDIVDRCGRVVIQGKRDDLLNERFFHHMFSWEVARWYGERGVSIWDQLSLAPECATTEKFRFAGIDRNDAEATRSNAITVGKSGNFDFVIKASPQICVEWKGPDMWQPQDVIEVLLKLLTESKSTIKIFTGILTSSSTGQYGHIEAATKYFRESVEFVCRVLGLASLRSSNLYAYLATIPESGPVRIHWGPVEAAAAQMNTPIADATGRRRD